MWSDAIVLKPEWRVNTETRLFVVSNDSLRLQIEKVHLSRQTGQIPS